MKIVWQYIFHRAIRFWMLCFNFKSPLLFPLFMLYVYYHKFSCKNNKLLHMPRACVRLTIKLRTPRTYYCHKQSIMLHSIYIKTKMSFNRVIIGNVLILRSKSTTRGGLNLGEHLRISYFHMTTVCSRVKV